MTFWEQLERRERPECVVDIAVGDGVVQVRLRVLLPAEWDALCEAYPAPGASSGAADVGAVDIGAMWPALLAASVDAPDGSPPRDPAWWVGLAERGALAAGERDTLTHAAWTLNQPRTGPDLGKD